MSVSERAEQADVSSLILPDWRYASQLEILRYIDIYGLTIHVIAESVVRVRVVGQTGQIDVPANLLICATGNNIKVRGDMVRRTIKCRMDTGVERTEERKFKDGSRQSLRP